jgi:hypothetical protein
MNANNTSHMSHTSHTSDASHTSRTSDNVRLLFEATFVGAYVACIYGVLSVIPMLTEIQAKHHIYYYLLFTLFITGFVKHVLGYYIKIHGWYCNYGQTCTALRESQSQQQHKYKSISTPYMLLWESMLEGLLFATICIALANLLRNVYAATFITGFAFHIITDMIGLHKSFCMKRCVPL